MKKNRGNKSKIKLAKEAKFKPKRWQDSHNSSKQLCLVCFKAYKDTPICCNVQTYNIGTRARPPKVRASKNEWKKFIDMFIHGGRSRNKFQLKQVIELRKKYNLSTFEDEKQLEKLENYIENDLITSLDIKRHEAIHIKPSQSFFDDIIAAAEKFKQLHLRTEINGQQVYVVPILASDDYNHYLPSDSQHFKIKKARTRVITSENGRRELNLQIMTNNTKELIPVNYRPNSKYAYRQNFFIFEEKLNAIAFQQIFLEMLSEIKETKNLDYFKELLLYQDIGFDKVLKKAPELLI